MLVLVEGTPTFLAMFDQVGGRRAYPNRVTDPDDDTDYAGTIAANRPLGPRSLIT